MSPRPMFVIILVFIFMPQLACRPLRGRKTASSQRTRPAIFAIDDGARIGRRSAVDHLLANPADRPVRLFGLRGETVAFQVVVSAGEVRLSGVTVQLDGLSGPAQLRSEDGSSRWSDIEHFITHDLLIKRRSGGSTEGESLGWQRGAMPNDVARGELYPDALIPIAFAPSFADYPMTVERNESRVVWIDITIPDAGCPSGSYRGVVKVRHETPAGPVDLARLEVELVIGAVPLPYAAARTMVYYDPQEIMGRVGGAAAVRHYLQLMHRHHLSTIYRIDSAAHVDAQRDELSGALFTREQGYEGPGAGRGPDVIAIGSYGSLGMPTPARLAQVAGAMRALGGLGLLTPPGQRDIFLYAVDEQCRSPLGPAWRKAIRESGLAELAHLRVGHTCGADPSTQGVDVAILPASAYSVRGALLARERGLKVWIYNGVLPFTGSFLLDGGALSLRANGWIQARYHIERWFYWESTFWNDDNRGGHGPYDPWRVAETFHNRDGDHANGDGVLVYPGKQLGAGMLSLGFDGVMPSIRLKQWRRGVCDAGYLALARQVAPDEAEEIARALVPRALSEAPGYAPWPTESAPYERARRQLFELIGRRRP